MSDVKKQIQRILETPIPDSFAKEYISRHDDILSGRWQEKKNADVKSYIINDLKHKQLLLKKYSVTAHDQQAFQAIEQGLGDVTQRVSYQLPQRTKEGYMVADVLHYLTYTRYIQSEEMKMRLDADNEAFRIVEEIRGREPDYKKRDIGYSSKAEKATMAVEEGMVAQKLEQLTGALFSYAYGNNSFASEEAEKKLIRDSVALLKAVEIALNDNLHFWFNNYLRKWQTTIDCFSGSEKEQFRRQLPPGLQALFSERNHALNNLPAGREEAYFVPRSLNERLDMAKEFVTYIGQDKRFNPETVKFAQYALDIIGTHMRMVEEIKDHLKPVVEQLNTGVTKL